MKIDNTVRVELDDDDIRQAIEQYVRIKLSTGPNTAKLKLSMLRIWDPHLAASSSMDQPGGGASRPAIDYGLEASVEFEPEPEPLKRELKP